MIKSQLWARIKRFGKLSFPEQILFIKALLIGTYYSLIIFFFPFSWYRNWLGVEGHAAKSLLSEDMILIIKRTEKAIKRVKRYCPWDIKCMAQALTAKQLLKQAKIPSTIYLGVGKENPEKLIAHAWLQCMDITITGNEEKSKFTPLVFFT